MLSLARQQCIMEMVIVAHTMVRSHYYHGQIHPKNLRISAETNNWFLVEWIGGDTVAKVYRANQNEMFPMYALVDKHLRTLSLEKEIVAVAFIIASCMLPEGNDITMLCKRQPSQLAALRYIFCEFPACFWEEERYWLTTVVAHQNLNIKLHNLRLLALRAQGVLRDNIVNYKESGRNRNWRWKDSSPGAWRNIFDIDARSDYDEIFNADFIHNEHRVIANDDLRHELHQLDGHTLRAHCHRR